jgi:hypothetical protein
MHLLEPDSEGWLKVTPLFLRAYYTRPEIHPLEGSCPEEIKLHEDLMSEPDLPVEEARLERLADREVADNYRVLLAYRELLLQAGTIEGAYLRLMRQQSVSIAPLFIDQMAHLIVHNILKDCKDPLRLRAGELFFREQSVSTEGGRLMLADEETLEMHARAGADTGLGQLLAETGTPMKSVELDVLDEDNKSIYWQRSDRFDTAIDFRFGQPALDAFARVIEGWLWHLMKLEVRVEPRPSIEDPDWRWHIGLDREATRILNALYEGRSLSDGEREQIIALFRMHVRDHRVVLERVRTRPVYLGLAMDARSRLKMKPQNLLTNLPLLAPA